MDHRRRSAVRDSTSGLTLLGYGGAGIGNVSTAVTDEDARAALEAAWAAGIRYFDTAPWYGLGLSEHRVGAFLRTKPRSDFVLSSKVGRILRPWPYREVARLNRGPWVDPLDFEVSFDYTYEGIMRAYEDSLQRLGLASVDLLVVHDLDREFHASRVTYDAYLAQLATGGYRALRELRSSGRIQAFGVGINIAGEIPTFLDLFDLDFFLVAGPYTLLRHDILETELARCAEAGVSLIIGGAFQFGALAIGFEGHRLADFPRLDGEDFERGQRIEKIAVELGVPLGAAALQLPAVHPLVRSVLFATLDGNQLDQAVGWFGQEIPAEFWQRLKSEQLVSADLPTPSGP
jgi:D-threo-aldose 1-dehydrogenase